MPGSDGNHGGKPRAKTYRRLIVAGAIIGLAGISLLKGPSHANSMSLDYNLARYVAGALRIEANGRVIDRISGGRNSSGGTYYKNRFSDLMEFRVLWYDAVETQAWAVDIAVRGRELSAFDPERTQITLAISVGPGADVLVTTSNPNLLRLIHEGRGDDATPEMLEDVVLRQVCATSLPLDDPRIAPIVAAAHDPNDSLSQRVQRKLDLRREFLANGGVIEPRCTAKE